MIQLRPYQLSLRTRIQAALTRFRCILAVAPCGAGKTVLFCDMAQVVSAKGKRIYLIAHRDELIQQISNTLERLGVAHSFIAAGRHYDPRALVQVCSIGTLARRKVPRPDLAVPDEAHHSVSPTWSRILGGWNTHVVGFTATPERLDGRGLGDVYQSLVLGPTTAELIDMGALVPYRLFAPPGGIHVEGLRTTAGDYNKGDLATAANKPSVTGDAIEHYRRLAHGRRAIVFCVSVQHAKDVAMQFLAAGYQAAWLDGSMSSELRRDTVDKFKDGRIQVLTSCDLVSEGFDLPAIEVAICLRPTQSLALWIQQAGRALRPMPGKSEAIILDHAGNAATLGLPDDPRDWTLEGREATGRGGSSSGPAVRICPKCFAAQRPGPLVCRFCGHAFPVTAREVEQIDGELVEIQRAAAKAALVKRRAAARTLDDLVAFAHAEGYRQPEIWARNWLRIRDKYTNHAGGKR